MTKNDMSDEQRHELWSVLVLELTAWCATAGGLTAWIITDDWRFVLVGVVIHLGFLGVAGGVRRRRRTRTRTDPDTTPSTVVFDRHDERR